MQYTRTILFYTNKWKLNLNRVKLGKRQCVYLNAICIPKEGNRIFTRNKIIRSHLKQRQGTAWLEKNKDCRSTESAINPRLKREERTNIPVEPPFLHDSTNVQSRFKHHMARFTPPPPPPRFSAKLNSFE